VIGSFTHDNVVIVNVKLILIISPVAQFLSLSIMQIDLGTEPRIAFVYRSYLLTKELACRREAMYSLLTILVTWELNPISISPRAS
jgi:hypothetical protein